MLVGGVGVGWGSMGIGMGLTVRVLGAIPVGGGGLIVADGSLGDSWSVTIRLMRSVSTVGLVLLRVRDSGLGDSGGSIGVAVAVTVAAVAGSRRVLLGGSITVVGSRSVLLPGVGAGDSHSASCEILH